MDDVIDAPVKPGKKKPVTISEESVVHYTDKQLRDFVSRVDNLAEQQAETAADMAELWKEIKDAGYDVKALKQAMKERADPEAARQHDLVVAIYRKALGVGHE